MDTLNPFAGTLAQSTLVVRQQSLDKAQQIRRSQAVLKNVASTTDSFEHQVESTEEISPIHDQSPGGRDPRQPSHHAEKGPKRPDEDGDPKPLDILG